MKIIKLLLGMLCWSFIGIASDDNLRDVGSELRCPTCTGLSVMDSDAPFSLQIRKEVETQLASGKSKDEILQFFVDRYGPWILRKPPVAGVNILVWLLPLAAFIVGPLIVWLVFWRRRADAPVNGFVPRSRAAILQEMQEDLAAMRRQGDA